MVQNPPCWTASLLLFPHWEIQNKTKSSLNSQSHFVLEAVIFFCIPVWRILYHVIVSCKKPPYWLCIIVLPAWFFFFPTELFLDKPFSEPISPDEIADPKKFVNIFNLFIAEHLSCFLLCSCQTLATFQRKKLQRCWAQHVSYIWELLLICFDMLCGSLREKKSKS